MKLKIIHQISRWKDKISTIPAEPGKVALGYALGVFLAATPFVGLKVFLALPLIYFYKWNKIAALIGIFHINPLTGPVFYGFSFLVGKTIHGSEVIFYKPGSVSIRSLFEMIFSNLVVFKCLLIGGLVIGLPASVAGYYIVRKYLDRSKKITRMPYEYN